MAITVGPHGTTTITGQDVQKFALLQLRARLKLEQKGLKGHGPSALSQAKKLLDVKGSYDKVLAALERKLEDNNG